jgi:PAS domain S-box-containing protein
MLATPWEELHARTAELQEAVQALTVENARRLQVEERLLLVLDHAPIAMIMLDADGIVTLCEGREVPLLGFDPDGFIGRSIFDLYAEQPSLHDVFRRALAGENLMVTEKLNSGLVWEGRWVGLRGDDGQPAGAICVASHITQRYLAEQRVAVQYAVAHALAFATDLSDVMPAILSNLCESLGWEFAACWLVDPSSDSLRCTSTHVAPGSQASPFAEASRQMAIGRDKGLIGRAWHRGLPVWWPNLRRESHFLRLEPAVAGGLEGALAFPIRGRSAVLGVIELYNRRIEPVDGQMLDVIGTLGSQIGQFIERDQALQAQREMEARYRSIIDGMPSALIIVDPQGRVEAANPAVRHMFGYDVELLVGRSVLSLLVPQPEHGEPDFMQQSYQRAVGRLTEWQGRRQNGDAFPLLLAVCPFLAPEGFRVALIGQDISRLRELDRLKKDFIAMVSHELRTPLTAIRSSLDLLGDGTFGCLPAEAGEVVTMAARETARMTSLINDLLDLSQIESGKLDLNPALVPCSDVFEQARNAVLPIANKFGIALQFPATGTVILADAERLIQVLVNLLSNAIKFSEPGSRVEVTLAEGDEGVTIAVVDQGCGIPPELHDMIFEPFAKVGGQARQLLPGTGLGLAICRTIIEAHGGTVGLHSVPAQGSTFWLRLPR